MGVGDSAGMAGMALTPSSPLQLHQGHGIPCLMDVLKSCLLFLLLFLFLFLFLFLLLLLLLLLLYFLYHFTASSQCSVLRRKALK